MIYLKERSTKKEGTECYEKLEARINARGTAQEYRAFLASMRYNSIPGTNEKGRRRGGGGEEKEKEEEKEEQEQEEGEEKISVIQGTWKNPCIYY